MSDIFQLELLPQRRMSWQTLAMSYGLTGIVLLVVIFAGVIWPDELPLVRRYTVTEIIPRPSPKPKELKLKRSRKIMAKLPPVPIEMPKLILPRIARMKPKAPPKELPPPVFEAKNVQPVVVPVSGARAPKLLYTGSFGSSAVPTLNVSPQKVQTGGFGDPNGLPGQGKQNAHLTSAALGSFDLPQGAGSGNGTGGAKGLKGTVASAGFGSGVAKPGVGDGRSNGRGVVAQTAFNSQELSTRSTSRAVDAGPASSPVEITYKAKPAYTEEARNLRLEGEVLLEVMFGANGELHVNRVVRGLGHGLDENAVTAANTMRFKPAQRNGAPVDSTAVVHVVFELAM